MSKKHLISKIMEMVNQPKNVVERVIEIREGDKKSSFETISRKIKRELGHELGADEVKKIWDEAKMILKGNIKEVKEVIELSDNVFRDISDAVGNKDSYEFNYDKDRYEFPVKDKATGVTKVYTVSREKADSLFKGFSVHGDDKDEITVMRENRMDAFGRGLVKSRLKIRKKSHVLSPISMEIANKNGNLEELITQTVEYNLEDRYVAMYDKAFRNKVNLDLKKFGQSKRGYLIFLEMLEERLEKYQPRAFDFSKIVKIDNDEILDAFLTDVHLGAKGTNDIRDRIVEFTNDLIKHKARRISISFGGDAGELFVPYGEMHVGQRVGMEEMSTADLIMLILECFEEMLVALVNAGKEVQFNMMKGNHDRFTEKKEFDPNRTPAEVVGKLLQKILKDVDIRIRTFQDKSTIVRSGNIKYIFLHGDGFSERELYKRVLKQREQGCYIVVVTGDKHHFKMLEINDEILRIQSPAMANKGQFAESLGLSSLPGALLFERNDYGNMDFTVKRYARSSVDEELTDGFE